MENNCWKYLDLPITSDLLEIIKKNLNDGWLLYGINETKLYFKKYKDQYQHQVFSLMSTNNPYFVTSYHNYVTH